MDITTANNIILQFLVRAVQNHCPCFDQQCNVQNISPKISAMLKKCYELSSQENLIHDQHCNTIYDNEKKILSDPEQNMEFYFSTFVSLGLLVESNYTFQELDKYNDSSSDISNDSELTEYDAMFLLWNSQKISWKSIQNLTKTDIPPSFLIFRNMLDYADIVDLVKLLFWFFRKSIVDSIIQSQNLWSNKCIAISAGSFNITSDYDVTVYGDCSQILAAAFEKDVSILFGDSPDIVFDTNVYSSSFIDMVEPVVDQWYTRAFCDPYNLWYFNSFPMLSSDQHVWASLKIFHALRYRNGVVDPFYDVLFAKMTPNEQKFANYLSLLKNTLDNIKRNVHNIGFLSKSKQNYNIADFSNDLSLINYKGKETYYTRGAFLDVVVNQQICKKGNEISMNIDSYLDSFLENLADFIIHDGKVKYMNRTFFAASKIDSRLKTNFYLTSVESIMKLYTKTDNMKEKEILRSKISIIGWKFAVKFLNVTSLKNVLTHISSHLSFKTMKHTVSKFDMLENQTILD